MKLSNCLKLAIALAVFTALAFWICAPLRAQTPAAAPAAPAPVWFTVAQESQSTSVTLPVGATYRFGDSVNNKWSASIAVVAEATFSPLYFPAGVFPFADDPDPGVAKELDVQETSLPQIVTVNGAPVTVPALPPPPVPTRPLTAFSVDFKLNDITIHCEASATEALTCTMNVPTAPATP